MYLREVIAVLVCLPFSILTAQTPETSQYPPQITLTVPSGVPIRLYLTKRIPKRKGAPVSAKVLDPVYAFDRLVIPAGSTVMGIVEQPQAIPRWERIRAILGGDFTPLHRAPVEFNTLVMPDGTSRPLRTVETFGLNSIVSSRPPRKQAPAPQNAGIVANGKQQVKDAIQGQVDRVRSISDTIRGPNKMEKLEDYLITRLPYHPRYIRRGTRFDAELVDPLTFGPETVAPEALASVGSQPPADTVVHARLLTPLDSLSSPAGTAVEAVLAEPVFTADHKLVLPEGTHLQGSVVVSKRARFFHRSGQLRFTFKEIVLPEEVARIQSAVPPSAPSAAKKMGPKTLQFRTQAALQGAESTGKAPLKVDGEGGVKAQESKTRFLAAAVSVAIARRAGDNDAMRNSSGQAIGQSSNVGGRTLGGGLGFGLLGSAIAQSSPYVGAAFGYYGMAWSLYANLIARGPEVEFSKDAMVDIRFNERTEPAKTKGAKGAGGKL